jgi:hypothetical protein
MPANRFLRAGAFLAILLPLFYASSRKLGDDVSTAWHLRDEPWDSRERAVNGSWFGVVQQLRAALPREEPVDIIMTTPKAWEVAIFAGSALSPRPCRFFLGEDAWRRRERAEFTHDARAVNAPAGPPPAMARVVLIADENSLRLRP